LESGAIYCISIILYLISVVRLNKPDSLPAISVFRAAIPQIMVRAILRFPRLLADRGLLIFADLFRTSLRY
jgi:hypothetical protein